MDAHQKDVVEGFIHDEICYGIPHFQEKLLHTSDHSNHAEAGPGDSRWRLVCLLRVDKEGETLQLRMSPQHRPAARSRAAKALELSGHVFLRPMMDIP
jgi:hypothetical protein